MNQRPATSSSARRIAPAQKPARPWVVVGLVISGVVAIGMVVFLLEDLLTESKEGSATPSTPEAGTAETSSANGAAVERSTRTIIDRRPRHETAGTRAETSDTPPKRVWPEPSPLTRQLVQSLSEFDSNPEKQTPEKIAAWKRTLMELQDQGTAALPAVAEFFANQQDVRFDAVPTANALQARSLRLALMKVLSDLPGPENVELQVEILRTTKDSDEVALLSSQLEMQVPGDYSDDIAKAAKTALENIRNGNFPGRDPGPMNRILKHYDEPAEK